MHAVPGSTYLLTEDLGEKITYLRHVGINTPNPDDPLFVYIQDQLAEALQKAIGNDYAVKRLKMRDLSDEIIGRITSIWGEDVLIVSTCPEIGQPSKGSTIEVNRLVDRAGKSLGLGARPGHPSIEAQISKIKARSHDLQVPIVIAEDGMFMGETMGFVVDQLTAAGANVAGVVAGFTFSNGPVERIAAHDVQVDVIHDFGPILDWVPDHDFLPFTPGSGKVLGVQVGSHLFPFYDHQHSSFSVSYVHPFGPVTDWAAIPEDKVREFSSACIQLSIKLYTELEKLNKRRIHIHDIVQSRQRVSIPISVGTSSGGTLPTRDAQVITFLSESL